MSKMIMISIVAALLSQATSAQLPALGRPENQTDEPAIPEMLEALRLKYRLPALAGAVLVDGEIVASGAVGVRRHGSAEKITADDKFHIGSITKSMTATVAAILVEQGKIAWTTTIGELFSEYSNDYPGLTFRGQIHSDYLRVTLEQLLAHRGGVPENVPPDLWIEAWERSGTPAEQRLAFIEGILARGPEVEPGTKTVYSNAGYTIAGVMLERASGKNWEELMRSMLFEPLEMSSAGFGAPATRNQLNQPWGHTRRSSHMTRFVSNRPVPPGPRADNPLAISPAGAVHCSVGDLVKYAAFHMAGARGEGSSLQAETFSKLHAPVGDENYALGWVVLNREWAGGPALMHNGSNTMFYAVVWIAPQRNVAVIVATNVGGKAAFKGCDEAATQLLLDFIKQ